MSEHHKVTESSSIYDSLEKMAVVDLLQNINQEDQKVAVSISMAIPQIEKFIDALLPKFNTGGRLIYIGAGTSGRLGILDASEIPPTYGLPYDRVIGLIAGGDKAIRKSVEFAEDSPVQGASDLQRINLTPNDAVIGIAASGSTPYVLGGVKYANEIGALTSCITNNAHSPVAESVAFPIEVIVGPEFVTGSTRMKSGTSQKLILNMISTTLMIKIGRVKGNKMINMHLSNQKLVNRGINFLKQELGVNEKTAEDLLNKYGSVKSAISNYLK